MYYQAISQRASLKQKPLFAILHGSVAWLVSVQWFICSVWYHVGLLPSSEGSTWLEGPVVRSLGAQLVFLASCLSSPWVSPWDVDFPQHGS